jgi:arylsulfatase A-like enzyme
MMAAMDEEIGRILDSLEAKKMRENTVVLFTSDNGGPQPGKVTNNGPLRGGKGGLFEGGVRVAACVAWTGHIAEGSVVKEPLHIVDVYPTVLKLAGVDVSQQKLPLDGLDVSETIAAGAPTPHKEILLNATPVNGAIRAGDWKLIVGRAAAAPAEDEDGGGAADVPAGKQAGSAERRQARQNTAATAPGIAADARVQLFNLATDPGEKKDLAADNPETVKELRAAYDKLAAQAVPPKAQPKAADFKSPAVWGER